jgi:hypothetical protein
MNAPRPSVRPATRSVQEGPSTRRILALAAATLALMLAGCATAPAPPAPPPGLADLLEQPAERALYDGLRAYDDARYAQAEAYLRRALDAGLANPRDRATAYKLLAFVTCTSNRIAECEAAFVAARQADPAFALGRAEQGHPIWGPVYRRVLP